MLFRIHRSDGKTGTYLQHDQRRAQVLVKRLDPARLFCSGPIIIGVHNPFSILNPDEVNWIEVETDLPTIKMTAKGVDQVRRLSGREEYESVLARQWPRWRAAKGGEHGLLEGLVELCLRGGASIYLHVTGHVDHQPLAQAIFGASAITASFDPNGTLYVNPKCIVRARVYHSKDEVSYPDGLWFAEADDI